ncbi:MAG: hypothetical protein U0792_04345 [Gemmataceae bacterium]
MAWFVQEETIRLAVRFRGRHPLVVLGQIRHAAGSSTGSVAGPYRYRPSVQAVADRHRNGITAGPHGDGVFAEKAGGPIGGDIR